MSKTVSGLALISIGIATGSISLFANLLTPLDMADWAWSLVGPWQDVTSDLWGRLLERSGLTLPGSLAPVLNVAAAILLTSYGVGLRDHEGPAKDLSHPRVWLFGAMLALLAIGYASLAGQPQPRGTGEAANSFPLLIFLAAATTSFSPAFAGRGNLTKHLWLLLDVLAILMGLNEMTKAVAQYSAE